MSRGTAWSWLAALWLLPAAVRAETPAPPTTEGAAAPAAEADGLTAPRVSGFLQAAYHTELWGGRGRRNPQLAALNQYTPTGNTFALHAAHVSLTQALGDSLSATIDLDAGYDAPRTASYPFKDGLFDVQEAYATYTPGPFSLTAGKFASYMGIEAIEGYLNANITRGYSYNLAEPNTHTGFKAHYAQGALDVGLGLVNGWDTLLDNNNDKTLIWRVALTPGERFTINVNGSFGSETENVSNRKRLSVDVNGAWSPREHLELRFQANAGWDGVGRSDRAHWYVCGVQPLYTGELFTLGARAELFLDPDGARAQLGPVRLLNLALTPGVIVGRALRARLEGRADIADHRVFGKPSAPRSSMLSLAIAAEYVF